MFSEINNINEGKIKLLFIVSSFRQGGAERYLFELCKELNNDTFSVEILTKNNGISEEDFYFDKIKKLKIPIHEKINFRLRPFGKLFRFFLKKKSFINNWIRKIFGKIIRFKNMELIENRFFDRFDIINVIQIENYYILQEIIPDFKNVVVHLMSNSAQHNFDIYAPINNKPYFNFIAINSNQIEEVEKKINGVINWLLFPLSINFKSINKIELEKVFSNEIKIGIFTRLSKEKPIQPLFECFSAILKQLDCSLHVFGIGNPKIFKKYLNRFSFKDKINFRGHVKSIQDTLVSEKIQLVWLLSFDSFLGYASIEIAAFGIPMIFWNIGRKSHQEILNETEGGIQSFNEKEEFINFNLKNLEKINSLNEIGIKLSEYVYKKNNILSNIVYLEKFFKNIFLNNIKLNER